jgi:hypothetical protein
MTGGTGTAQGRSTSASGMAAPGAGVAFRPRWRYSALDLRPLPGAVPSARLHTRLILTEWGLAAVAADGELIVSELVTNGVRACGEIMSASGPPPVRLRLTCRSYGVLIEVWDGHDQMPTRGRDAPPDAEGGWGLILVDALSDRWGAYPTAGGGKAVWAVLST